MDVKELEKYVAAVFGISVFDIKRHCRKLHMAEARQMLWKLLIEEDYRVSDLTHMYDRHHGAISSGLKRINMKIAFNRQIELKYKMIKEFMAKTKTEQ